MKSAKEHRLRIGVLCIAIPVGALGAYLLGGWPAVLLVLSWFLFQSLHMAKLEDIRHNTAKVL